MSNKPSIDNREYEHKSRHVILQLACAKCDTVGDLDEGYPDEVAVWADLIATVEHKGWYVSRKIHGPALCPKCRKEEGI